MAKYYDRCWNPIYGCSGDFEGCDRCFAKSLAERRGRGCEGFGEMKINRRQLFRQFDRDSKLVAVCTQSDLFQGEGGCDTWLVDTVLKKCNANRQNNYLFLTKFSSNMKGYFSDGGRGFDGIARRLGGAHMEPFSIAHCAFGVTVCNDGDMGRIRDLRETDGIQRRFVAFEPLLAPVTVTESDLDGIGWVIVGAETGDDPRSCRQEWMLRIVDVADRMKIPVFVNAVHTADGKVTTEFVEMDKRLRRSDIPYGVK